MKQFNFENGLTPTPKHKHKRTVKRVFGASCQCFDLGLECPHIIKERTTSIPDSIKKDDKDLTPEWQRYFAIERNQNTQRYKAA